MKVAIHHIEKGFSRRWLSYCDEENIDYILVDLRKSDIIKTLQKEEITHLMCHVPNEDWQLINISNGVFSAAEMMGIKTFPSNNERWHFDNKIYQKYLFESLNVPFVKTEVFYSKDEALKYAKSSNYPFVSKLKRGAGSVNVSLLHNQTEAENYITKMFTEGINPVPAISDNIRDKINYSKKFKNPLTLTRKAVGYFKRIKNERQLVEKEKSYVMFQDFLPNNNFDTRIVIANDIAFGLRRKNRENDFRASGSGNIDYTATLIDIEMINLAFKISNQCGFNLMGYDFLYKNEQPLLVEMCYAFTADAYDACEGYWTKDLQFHREHFYPHKRMIKQFLEN